jgi:UDP-glucose 4-epimerase
VKVLVTGARGKVGVAATAALQRAGHDVLACDLGPAVHERPLPGEVDYVQADLTDAASAYALVRGRDAVVHAAAIPDPLHHPAHVVLHNNLMSALAVVEACVAWETPRLVNLSSETVPGFIFGGGRLLPQRVPIDEATPCAPRDPYGFGKHVVEQWCEAATHRSDLRVLTIRPSWVQYPGNYERNLGPLIRDPFQPHLGFWAYSDLGDLAEAIRLAVESDVGGHEVLNVAQPDNAVGLPLAELVGRAFPDAGIEVRDTGRPDASGLDSSKAMRLLGWVPQASWRQVLDDDGRRREPDGGPVDVTP